MKLASAVSTALLMVAAVAAIAAVMAFQSHRVYLATRMLALVAAASAMAAQPQRLIEFASASPKISIALGFFLAFLFLGLIFLERVIRFLAWMIGNPNAPNPF